MWLPGYTPGNHQLPMGNLQASLPKIHLKGYWRFFSSFFCSSLRGHPHMISDFWGPFLTYLPTHIRFFHQFRAILLLQNRLYPIFINLPTYPTIGYHMWMAPFMSASSNTLRTSTCALFCPYKVTRCAGVCILSTDMTMRRCHRWEWSVSECMLVWASD